MPADTTSATTKWPTSRSAAINTKGPTGAVDFINRWRPRSFTKQVATALTVRLAEVGRDQDINDLVVAARTNKNIQRAAASTLFDYNVTPTKGSLKALVKLLTRRAKPFTNRHGERTGTTGLDGFCCTPSAPADSASRKPSGSSTSTSSEPHLPDSASIGTRWQSSF